MEVARRYAIEARMAVGDGLMVTVAGMVSANNILWHVVSNGEGTSMAGCEIFRFHSRVSESVMKDVKDQIISGNIKEICNVTSLCMYTGAFFASNRCSKIGKKTKMSKDLS